MQETPKETVIIVHGTWAAPSWAGSPADSPLLSSHEPNAPPKWYEIVGDHATESSFVVKLDEALRLRGSHARCWAHCNDRKKIFHWSGENNWAKRTEAAYNLRDYVYKLWEEGWRCHLVAHSHGGNIVVEAFSRDPGLSGAAGFPGKIVTVGTPFIDTASPMMRRGKAIRDNVTDVINRAGQLTIAIFLAAALELTFDYFGVNIRDILNELRQFSEALWSIAHFIVFVCLWYASGAGIYICRKILGASIGRDRDQQIVEGGGPTQPSFLSISSKFDEAWQSLHRIRNIQNPIAPDPSFFKAYNDCLKSETIAASLQGEKSYSDLGLHGRILVGLSHFCVILLITVVPYIFIAVIGYDFWFCMLALSIYIICLIFILYTILSLLENDVTSTLHSVFFAPFRWCFQRAAALTSSIGWVITIYAVRWSGWSVIRKLAMGLGGYELDLPQIEQRPSNIFEGAVRYEDMPNAAERRALANRSAWISRWLGDTSRTFSNITITAADITSLLRDIEADQSLVHGAYYSDDECIGRIADWISGSG
jgi:hypothetical protein